MRRTLRSRTDVLPAHRGGALDFPRRRAALALVLALQVAASVQAQGTQTAAVRGAAPSAAVEIAPTTPAGAVDYRLGAGDTVRIAVFQNPDLTLETRLTETGTVSYPLVGTLRLGGLTVGAAEKLIADGLRAGNFVRNPQVTLTLLQARGHQASVLGQVNRPGRYVLDSAEMRLTDVLALAGGAAATGADRVVVTGLRDGKPFRAEVDLPSVFDPAGRERDLVIRHGDVVWVDRQPLVYIYGEVQKPGAVRLERDMTVMQALATGGGLTARGTERGIRVHRKNSDGSAASIEARMADRLQPGDVVYVRESLF